MIAIGLAFAISYALEMLTESHTIDLAAFGGVLVVYYLFILWRVYRYVTREKRRMNRIIEEEFAKLRQ